MSGELFPPGTREAKDGTLYRVPTGARIDPEKRARTLRLLSEGHTIASVAPIVGMAKKTVRAVADAALAPQVAGGGEGRPPPPEAIRALDDFGYFRRRYFGRVHVPWQVEAGETLCELLASPHKEFVVLNAPPGVGKSSLLVHDWVCWLLCRDRTVRVLIGSRTERQATTHVNRLRRSFSRVGLPPVDDDDIARGLAVAPEASLVKDYGRFQPLGRSDLWTASQFVVAQPGELAIIEKESSVAAYGMDSGFLGGRFDVCVWDDLIDRKVLRTVEARENLMRTYEDEMETRVEPGGLLVLEGQRMAADDLYRHALDMKVDVDEETGEGRRKYRHIKYLAHYEDRCRGIETHGRDVAEPWPDGCLLDPLRLPWRELATIRANRAEKYSVLFQQEDVDPDRVLVPRIWIDGGKDPITGEQHPGCWDHDRGLAEVPVGITSPYISVAACDPSPSRYWAIGWWLIERSTERRYLLDLIRQPMEAPEFLDWNYAENRFTGVMEDWQRRSLTLGAPISHWIVEINSARFLYQHDYVKRWQALHRVALVSHTTQHNRNDAEFGVQSIAPHYKFGRVRLPGKTKVDGGSAPGRPTAMKLVDEVTRWPDSATDDTVLMHWFVEWNLPRIAPPKTEVPKAKRPSWL